MIKAKIAILGLFTAVLLCGSYIKSPIEITRASEPDFKDDFESLNTKASLNVSYSTNTIEPKLVTSTADLVAGCEYIIGNAYIGAGKFMSNKVTSNYIGEEDGNFINKFYSDTTNILRLKLEEDSSYPGKIFFKTVNYKGSDGYLNITDDATTNLVIGEFDSKCSVITPTVFGKGANYSFYATYTKTSGTCKIRYSTDGFKAISSGVSKEVYIYKLVNNSYSINRYDDGKNMISIRFSGIVPMSLYIDIENYFNNKMDWSIQYHVGSVGGEMIITNGAFVNYENEKTDVGRYNVSMSGFFRYSIVIDKIPSDKFDVDISATAKVSGYNEYMEECTCSMLPSMYSVNSIAKEYLNKGLASGHEGFLTWLKDYKG